MSATASALENYEGSFAGSVAFEQLLLGLDYRQTQGLLSESESIASLYQRTLAQSQIIRRLAVGDPVQTIEYSRTFPRNQTSRFIDLIFREWSVFDLEEAISFAQSLNSAEREIAIEAIVRVRDDLLEETLIDIGYRLGQEFHASNLLDQSRVQGSIGTEDPEATWLALVSDPWELIDQRQELFLIAQEWVTRDGLEVLHNVAQSIQDGQTRANVLKMVLGQHVYSDPQEAFETAVELVDETSWRIVQTVLSSWARFAPKDALNALKKLEPSTLHTRLFDSVIKSWAITEPWELLENLSLLPIEMQFEARNQVIRSLALQSPNEAARLLSEIPQKEKSYELARELAQHWSNVDIGEALNWALASSQFEGIQQELVTAILEHLTLDNLEVFAKAIFDHPIDQDSIGLEASLIGKLATLDISQAIDLLPQIRNERTRLLSYSAIGITMIASDEFERVQELASQLPTNQRSYFYDAIFEHWTLQDPDTASESIDNLPTMESKSRAALWLLVRPKHLTNFSSTQIEKLKSQLTSEDSQDLENDNVRSKLAPNGF